ncbi:hypothetical protein NIES267_66860 [Calothrix parasitica NIES-267]|uniref:DUF6745 domain-containing protein n=1 Tax=Calothrix parasitica NIES-267 TaxID=1973488 RepID=A0A1Z4M1B7_9CYAN|nr:hypothetical protein NIES267_66860 [Calothrix parasitica NIES-267]
MLEPKISKLTLEQEVLIPIYREKWKKIALSTERIDRDKAAEAVKQAYALIGEKEPEILFFKSPCRALQYLSKHIDLESECKIPNKYGLRDELTTQLDSKVRNILQKQCSQIWILLEKQLDNSSLIELSSSIERDFKFKGLYSSFSRFISFSCIQFDIWNFHASRFDFCISVLNCYYPQKEWLIFQSLVKNCGWIFPFENICIVSERPQTLLFDNENRFHAEGKPAIEFADGYDIDVYHGVTLPFVYGKHHPKEWEPSWLLQEQNAELRKILIQEIGYNRIIEELQATEIDFYQEYTLLKINSDIDIEPIYLLKMTCPSTGHIHVLRVSPEMKSAHEAITWINWGIPPEDFVIQT